MFGPIDDPALVKRTYDDIERILHQNQVEYKVHEEHHADGTFKSYVVEA